MTKSNKDEIDISWGNEKNRPTRKKKPRSSSKLSSSPRININDTIGGVFTVRNILGGEGISGMGVVYICYHKTSSSYVALKTFQDKFIFSQHVKSRFKREATAWICLGQHPNIVRAFTVLEFDSRLFVMLEFIPPDHKKRNTLTHYLKAKIPLWKLLEWCIQFCHGMEYAVLQGVTPHRDIKPDNIMITRDGDVKITDFGLARLWDKVDFSSDILADVELKSTDLSFFTTSAGKSVVGTLPWMSPEQFDGNSDTRSDVYSFGIVLYQILNNGKLPFTALTLEDYSKAHKKTPVPRLKSKLFPVIKRCLQKNPDKRFKNFKELRFVLVKIYKMLMGKNPPTFPIKTKFTSFDHIGRGNAFHSLGMLDEAIQEYKKALELKPDIAAAYKYLGLAFYKKSWYDEALAAYTQAIRIHPMWAEVHLYRGNVYLVNGQFKEAADEYREALRWKPRWPEAHCKLGDALKEEGLLDKAIVEYRKSLKIRSDDQQALSKLGIALKEKYMILKSNVQNMISMEASSLALPARTLTDRMLYLVLGDEAYFVDELTDEEINDEFVEMLEYDLYPGLVGPEKIADILEEAVNKLEDALILDSGDSWTRYHLGTLMAEKKAYSEMISELTMVAREQPGLVEHVRPELARAYYNLGIEYRDDGNLDDAVEALKKAIIYDSDLEDAHIKLGNLYEEMEMLDKAVNVYRKVLDITPENDNIRIRLGNNLYQQGLLDEAIKQYRIVLKNKIDYCPAVANLGLVFKEKGDFTKALKYLRKAVRLEPLFAPSYVHLGLTYLEVKELEKGIRQFKKAIKVKPSYAIAHYYMGEAYYRLGKPQKAVSCYNIFIGLASDRLPRYIGQARERIVEITGE